MWNTKRLFLFIGAVSILIAAVVVFQVIKKDNTMTGSIGALSPEQVAVNHVHLNLKVDFEKKILVGEAILNITQLDKSVSSLILDSNDLKISNVIDNNSGAKLKYTVSEPVITLGSKLEIELPVLPDNKGTILIEYSTSSSASGLQWLSPAETVGKVHPYLFSQCQLTVPTNLTALMSALPDGEPKAVSDSLRKFSFKQPVPIPSYLIAIAVGNLESREVGPRSKVWSEPEMIEASAYEFVETDKFLKTAEDICGPYVWSIYDLLVLPPSFPFGGMENPCLTFVTPTLLAGDRSLVSVVAHEIAHSWTGNLVTQKNFEHFWLNEGFTMFVERKILGRIGNEAERQFSALRGLDALRQSVEDLGPTSPFTKLVVDLKGVDPDDAFSTVPYEKGHTFLFYLESILGGPSQFEPFLKAYLDKYKYKSIVTDDFRDFLNQYFAGNPALKQINWDEWLYSVGMPKIIPDYDKSLSKASTDLAEKWIEWDESKPCPFVSEDLKSFSYGQTVTFLNTLLNSNRFSVSKVKKMEDVYALSSVKNAEIKFRWLRLCIKNHREEQVDAALKFITDQGRMKYVRPIYRDLYAWEEVRDRAIKNFLANRQYMMHVSAFTVAKDLHLRE
ncbi:unnamed protein product [Bemisia tabaci]|uniref:Peptidase M1 leukotriene A4 hydrolase/aminopeptidase C-terminal domain-containing protein n=1 Tax=Bemisia tabaci TaxID=7038 RepID=A0A9P0F6X2_BEMTA|nr:unnamed protein product [Bemisia tabaci]